MLHFLITIGICEIFVFLIALLHFQGKCEKPKSLSELSLPKFLSNKTSYNNDACTYNKHNGLIFFQN